MEKRAVTLAYGIEMPLIGLGTWKMSDDEAERAVESALAAGYRLIDTATLYGNERGVGRALRASGIARKELFITTKLWPTDFFKPRDAFEASRERLGLEYVDLYLVHWPIPMMPKSVWQALEKIYDDELARAIGVSNYGIGDIEQLLTYARITPAVDQIKCSPFDYPAEIFSCCEKNGIIPEAYSPLNRGARLDDPALAAVASAHGKTAAQIMIRWCIEHGIVTIPKSSDPARIRENVDVFDFALSPEEVRALDALSD